MRVALNGWFWHAPETGSGQYVRRLARALRTLPSPTRPELDVLVPRALSGDDHRLADAWDIRLHAHPISPTHLNKVWWEQVAVVRFAQRVKADLLHIPYWAPPAVPPRRGGTKKRARMPVVVTVHDLIPRLLPAYRGGAAVRLYTALVSATTRRVDLVLTDSDSSKADIIASLGIPADCVRAIPLAVGEAYTSLSAPRDAEVRQRLELPDAYLLYLGGFDQRKNLATLFAAFAIVRKHWESARLVIAGKLPRSDTGFTPDPRRLAREAGIPAGAVRFLGFVAEEDKPALLRGATAFACPSIYEGFGYPCLEAIACGTPVVGSQTSSLPQVVGPAGVLLPPDDHAGMAGALLQLLVDADFRAELEAATDQQARRFSWRRTADETLAAYHSTLSP